MRRTLLLALALTACNNPPSEPVILLAPDAPTTVDDIRLELVEESVDPDGDDIGHRVRWFLNGTENTDVEGRYVIDAALTTKGQTWQVEVIGWDGLDDAEPVTAEVTVVNSLPIAEVTLAPSTPNGGDDLVASVTLSDADDDPVTAAISWAKDGTDAGLTEDTVPASETTTGETWAVRVTPNDGDADGPVASADVTIGNETPFVAAARVDPSALYTGTVASCVGAGWTDDDGDPETYLTEWLVDGALVADTETLDGATYFDRGDSVSCRLTPVDPYTQGDPVTSFGATVKNSFPVMLDLVVEPDPPRTDDTIEVSPSMFDADGDTVVAQYTWFVEGVEVSTSSFLRGTEDFDKGDEVEVHVNPFDGIDLQGPSIWTATVENTPPTAPVVSISPTPPTADDDLECVIDEDSVDADGDSVGYSTAWLVNGKNTAVGATLSASFTTSGDSVECRVTPSDGDDDGPYGSASVTLP